MYWFSTISCLTSCSRQRVELFDWRDVESLRFERICSAFAHQLKLTFQMAALSWRGSNLPHNVCGATERATFASDRAHFLFTFSVWVLSFWETFFLFLHISMVLAGRCPEHPAFYEFESSRFSDVQGDRCGRRADLEPPGLFDWFCVFSVFVLFLTFVQSLFFSFLSFFLFLFLFSISTQ